MTFTDADLRLLRASDHVRDMEQNRRGQRPTMFHVAPLPPPPRPMPPPEPTTAPAEMIEAVAKVVGGQNAPRIALALERARWNGLRSVYASGLWFDRSGRGRWIEVPT